MDSRVPFRKFIRGGGGGGVGGIIGTTKIRGRLSVRLGGNNIIITKFSRKGAGFLPPFSKCSPVCV